MADHSPPPPRYTIWQAITAALNLSMRAMEEVRALAARPPQRGPPGKDGLGFDDLTIEYDGRRTMTFRLQRDGVESKIWSFVLPVQIYCGVYREGERHERGDTVTWGGSLYHCNEPTSEKPGAGSTAWTLAAKRGQDGKDGKPGIKGDPGSSGRPGKDLTQLGSDGSKW